MFCYHSFVGNIKTHQPKGRKPLYWLNGTYRCQVLEILPLNKLTFKRTEKKKGKQTGSVKISTLEQSSGQRILGSQWIIVRLIYTNRVAQDQTNFWKVSFSPALSFSIGVPEAQILYYYADRVREGLQDLIATLSVKYWIKKAKVVIADREREEANLKKLKKTVFSNDGLVSSAFSAILELCRDKAEKILLWDNTLPLLASVKE